GGVERAAHGVVTHARQVLDATAADQHHAVLLQVVALAADVRDHLVAIGQAHLGHLAKGRVRLLRGGGVHAGAHAAALRAVGQRRRRALVDDLAARLAHQLVDRCHRSERFLGFGACALVKMTAGGGAPCLPRRKSIARADGNRQRKPCPDPPPRWPRPGAKALFRPSWAGHEALPAPHSEIWAGPGARRDVTASVAGGFLAGRRAARGGALAVAAGRVRGGRGASRRGGRGARAPAAARPGRGGGRRRPRGGRGGGRAGGGGGGGGGGPGGRGGGRCSRACWRT